METGRSLTGFCFLAIFVDWVKIIDFMVLSSRKNGKDVE
ncbi:hypothetical protein CHY_2328 [Carboxydothermus hydrogenoformans Z-2901]|uniref:Uncharacterized protein n=1 Tax=Carboxydothermus hydrogenoformans (strain ATCC BAA-161 / DSM 6008 / Z-2901) TaxID=246194 RepID=Q3A9P7_CARHZ|nr:hypothetical protein CHY_2328 [Carboxydothermus hydrogenoformans Z-2901]